MDGHNLSELSKQQTSIQPQSIHYRALFPSLQATAFALILVDLFGWRDSNVHGLTAELLLHASVVGVWFSLNSMGHHIWKIILSKVNELVSPSMTLLPVLSILF